MKYGIINFLTNDELSVEVGNSFSRLTTEHLDFLTSSPPELIYAISTTERTVVYEVELPTPLRGRNLEIALWGMLLQILPVSSNEIVWLYRHLDYRRYKLCAIHRDEFARIINWIESKSIPIDIFIPGQLIDNLSQCPDCVPVTSKIHEAKRPARYKKTKVFYATLFLLSLTLIIIVSGRQLKIYQTYISAQNEFDRALRMEIKKQQEIFKQLSAEQALLGKIQEAKPGGHSLGPLLAELTQKLPAYMWITNFSQKNDQVDITVNSAKDDPALYKTLNESRTFQLINLRKSRTGTDRVVFYLKLRSTSL